MKPSTVGQWIDLVAAAGCAAYGAALAMVPGMAPLAEFASPEAVFALAGAAFLRWRGSVMAVAKAAP